MATSWFDAMLGRLYNAGLELELRGALNFVGFTITPFNIGGKPAGWTITSSGGGGGGDSAADVASVLTTADEHLTLTNARRLVAGSGVTFTDAGAGSTLTIAASGGGGVGDTAGFSPTFRTDTPGGDVAGTGGEFSGIQQQAGDSTDLTYTFVMGDGTTFGGANLFLELPVPKAIIFAPTPGVQVIVTTTTGLLYGYVGVVAESGASVTIPAGDLSTLSSGDGALIHLRVCTGT